MKTLIVKKLNLPLHAYMYVTLAYMYVTLNKPLLFPLKTKAATGLLDILDQFFFKIYFL